MKKKARKKITIITPSIELMIHEAVDRQEGTLEQIAQRFNVSLRSVCSIKAKYKKATQELQQKEKEKEKPKDKETKAKKKKEDKPEYVLLPEHVQKYKEEHKETEAQEVTVEEIDKEERRDAHGKTEKVLDSVLDVLLMRLEREKLYMLVHPTALRGPMDTKELIDGLKAAGQFVLRKPLDAEDMTRGVKKLHNLFAEEYKKNQQHGKNN